MSRHIKMCESEMWAEIQPMIRKCMDALLYTEVARWEQLGKATNEVLQNAITKEIEDLDIAQKRLNNFRLWCETGKYPRPSEPQFNNVGAGI